jgi:hypothetical protein
MSKQFRKWGLRGSAVGIVALVSSVGFGMAVSTAAPRPHVAVSHTLPNVSNFFNSLASNTNGWCTFASGCNGVQSPTTYGTIDSVPSTFSNYGGYAPSVPGPIGQTGSYARVSGSGDSSLGCLTQPGNVSSPGDENCSGPYTLYGNDNQATVFPTHGFTTSIKIYLNRTWAAANPGQVVDWDVALNTNTAAYLQDYIFNLCSTSAGGGGWYASVSSNAGACSTGPAEIKTSGWYTFVIDFHPVGSNVDVNYSIKNPVGNSVAGFPIANVNSGHATSSVGGPAYGWLPDEDVLGLPIARSSLTVNS